MDMNTTPTTEAKMTPKRFAVIRMARTGSKYHGSFDTRRKADSEVTRLEKEYAAVFVVIDRKGAL